MALKTYYVRTARGRKYRSPWVAMRGESAENVRNRYVRETNAYLREVYAPYPDLLAKELVTSKEVAVRTTPPSRGDVGTLEYLPERREVKWTDQYVPRRLLLGTRTAVQALPDRQMEVLIKKSRALKKPVSYSDDLYVHDRQILRRDRPRAFLWVVRDWGTHLYPLDSRGTPLDKRGYEVVTTSVKYHAQQGNLIYLVTGTTIKKVSEKQALAAIGRAKKGQ